MEPNEQDPNAWQAPDSPPSMRIPATPMAPNPKEKRGCLRRVLMAIGFMIALFVILAFLVFRTTAGAEKDARAFVTSVFAGNTDDAWSRTSSAFREQTSKPTLVELVTRLSTALPNPKIVNIGRSIAKATGKPTTATITYRVSTATRKAYSRVMLIKQSGKWRVENYESSQKEFPATI